MGTAVSARFAGSNAHYVRRSFGDFLAARGRLGMNSLEIRYGMPHFLCGHRCLDDGSPVAGVAAVASVAAALAGSGAKAVALSPAPYGYSLAAAPDSPLIEASVLYYFRCVVAAAESRIPVLCLGVPGGCRDLDYAEQWEGCRGALIRICGEARARGVMIALGISPKSEACILMTPTELARMLDEVGSPNLGVMLDTWLACLLGESPSLWFDRFGKDIIHVRFRDGRNDGPRAWGEGCLPCGRMYDEIAGAGYEGPLSLVVEGDRYIADPEGADSRNLEALRSVLPPEAWTPQEATIPPEAIA